jgi:uncharacterized protein DUF6174
MKIIVLAILCVALSVLWFLYRPPLGGERREWERLRPAAYTFEYQYTCFCPGSGAWWRITVHVDSVTDVQLIDSTQVRGLTYARSNSRPTLTSLFDEIASNASRSSYYRASYDPRWHFPVHASGDRLGFTDSYWTIDVRNYRPHTSRVR